MADTTCPLCEMNEILTTDLHHECLTCGHEWDDAPVEEAAGPRGVERVARFDQNIVGHIGIPFGS